MTQDETLRGQEAWRQRAEQLQGALDSRIVIEQAKGMLRERLGLPVESAFELLPMAARSSQQKLHTLAAEVVASYSTPDAIVQVLGHHPETFLTMPRKVRIAQTEEFFWKVNDAIVRRAPRNGPSLICECANPYCNEKVEVSAGDVEVLHSQPGYYVIMPGHEIPDVDFVFDQKPTYSIITQEKVQ